MKPEHLSLLLADLGLWNYHHQNVHRPRWQYHHIHKTKGQRISCWQPAWFPPAKHTDNLKRIISKWKTFSNMVLAQKWLGRCYKPHWWKQYMFAGAVVRRTRRYSTIITLVAVWVLFPNNGGTFPGPWWLDILKFVFFYFSHVRFSRRMLVYIHNYIYIYSFDNVSLFTYSAKGPWNKSLNSIFPTKYGIPKSLKVSHWLSEFILNQYFHSV